MADAEYMMNNYTTAQNQGMWDDNYRLDADIPWYIEEGVPMFDGYSLCLDETCDNYDGITF